MKKLNVWMLLCILFCGLTLTSCKDDDDDVNNGFAGDDGKPSAVDNGRWTDLSEYMDTSVSPGDDFFMYCNGTYWKNTTVNMFFMAAGEKKGYTGDLVKAFDKKVEALAVPAKDKFLKDFDKRDQTAAQAQQLYDKVLKESGLEAATTKEEAWKAAARLAKSGSFMMIRLVPFSKGGTIRLYATADNIEYMSGPGVAGSDGDGDGDGDADARHAHRTPTYSAAFVKSLQPVTNATRSISETEWPMLVTFLKELGFNPEEVYTVSDYYAQLGRDPQSKLITDINKALKQMQDMSVNDFKQMAMGYFSADTTFISTGAQAAVNKELAKNFQMVDKESIGSYMDKYYFSYDISKEVGEKLVTAADILHGEQAVQEIMEVFTERIMNNTWLSEGSKKNALEKLNNMSINVGRPDKWIPEALNNIESCTSALEDLYSIRKTRLNAYKALSGKPAKQYCLHAMLMDNSDTTLGEANAFYQPNYNSITLLPFYITAPWYDASQNSAINYETYNTFAHEITHGFDTDGSKFNKYGDPTPLWATQADSEEFTRRANQLIAWFSSFDVLPDAPGVKANGKVTIGEETISTRTASRANRSSSSWSATSMPMLRSSVASTPDAMSTISPLALAMMKVLTSTLWTRSVSTASCPTAMVGTTPSISPLASSTASPMNASASGNHNPIKKYPQLTASWGYLLLWLIIFHYSLFAIRYSLFTSFAISRSVTVGSPRKRRARYSDSVHPYQAAAPQSSCPCSQGA